MILTFNSSNLAAIDASPQQWFIILGIIVFVILLLNMKARRRAQVGRPSPSRRGRDALEHDRSAQRDMERLMVELNELARQIHAQIDTRFAKLEKSIADADRRIQFLRVLLDAAKKAQLLEDSELQAIRSDSAEQAPQQRPGGLARLDVTVDDDSAPHEHSFFESEPPAESIESDSNSAVYRLADEGRNTVEIARALRRNVGEVELILNLRDRGDAE